MTGSLGTESRAISEADDAAHEHGGGQDWTERIAFNFFDPGSETGGVVSLEYRPGERRGVGEVDLFLPGGVVATSLARDANTKRSDLRVGRLAFECAQQMKRWTIRCADTALVMPGAGERRGVAAPIEIDLAFDAWTPAAGWGARRTEVNDLRFASIVSAGSFEQAGAYAGTVRTGTHTYEFNGHGFRERVWGRREYNPETYWQCAAFGEDLCVSAGRVCTGGNESKRDWVARAGNPPVGEDVALDVDVVTTIPDRGAKIERSMARFRSGARETLGLLERVG